MLENIPRFEWNSGANTFTPSLPARVWTPADETVGGSRKAAGGVPASYIVRRDALVTVPLRIIEAEWAALLALVSYGQGSGIITWFPDGALAESFPVYLETPAAGERWAPTRDGQYPRVMELTLTLRGAGPAPWRPYFST